MSAARRDKGYHYVLIQRNAAPPFIANASRTNYTVVARFGDMYDNAEAVRVSVNDSVTISGFSPVSPHAGARAQCVWGVVAGPQAAADPIDD